MMEQERPGVLRPIGGTKKFRRNCRIVAEGDAIAVSNVKGNVTRFLLDGTENAPARFVEYAFREPFQVVDGQGRGLILTDNVQWDDDEQAQFCKVAGLDSIVVNEDPAPMRPDGVKLEEPAWMRRSVASAPYALGVGVALAPIGRAFDLPVWLMLLFLPWLLLYPLVRAAGYFAPRRIGPAQLRREREHSERVETKRRGRRGKAAAS